MGRNRALSREGVLPVTLPVAQKADIRRMSRRVINRSEWASFVDAFSRCHDGWLVSLGVEEGASPRSYVARDSPLRGVVAELDEDVSSMMVFTGETTPHATHFVPHATALEVEETPEGAEAELTITDESGVRTIVEFRSPMRPELVDGIARGEGHVPHAASLSGRRAGEAGRGSGHSREEKREEPQPVEVG